MKAFTNIDEEVAYKISRMPSFQHSRKTLSTADSARARPKSLGMDLSRGIIIDVKKNNNPPNQGGKITKIAANWDKFGFSDQQIAALYYPPHE